MLFSFSLLATAVANQTTGSGGPSVAVHGIWAIVILIGGVAAAVGFVWRIAWPTMKAVVNIAANWPTLEAIAKQFHDDGNGSLRSAINKMSTAIDNLSTTLAQVTVDVADVKQDVGGVKLDVAAVK